MYLKRDYFGMLLTSGFFLTLRSIFNLFLYLVKFSSAHFHRYESTARSVLKALYFICRCYVKMRKEFPYTCVHKKVILKIKKYFYRYLL